MGRRGESTTCLIVFPGPDRLFSGHNASKTTKRTVTFIYLVGFLKEENLVLTLEVTLTLGFVKHDILFQRQTNLLYLESCIRHPGLGPSMWPLTMFITLNSFYNPELFMAPHKVSDSSFIK